MKLSYYLKLSNTTQRQFAYSLGLQQSVISKYITSKRKLTAETISKIQKITNGMVTYEDWVIEEDSLIRDLKSIKSIIKERKIRLQNLAGYLGFSGSRLSQKFTDNSFSDKEIAKILYYINNCNTVTGELKDPDTNIGYVKIFRKHKLLSELLPTELKLLMVIVLRANSSQRALIGDYEAMGLTEYEYRRAKDKLASLKYCEFTGTEKGTIAKILPNKLFDL